MTDYFAVLQQPRRPWLDPEQLKQQYQELTFVLHPDRTQPGGNEIRDFAAVTEAYRALTNPRLRLRHLLELEGEGSSDPAVVSNDLAELFMDAAALVGEIDAFLQKRAQTGSVLGRALSRGEGAKFENRLDTLLARLQNNYESADQDVRRADELWTIDRSKAAERLRKVVDRLAYLDRWIAQLREKQFQLSS